MFYHNATQKKLALASRDRQAKKLGHAVDTPILPVADFTAAEDYHQKFYLRQNAELEKELKAFYPAAAEFMNSTAAMRLNAYLAGHGTLKALDKEIDQFGLSANGKKQLRTFVKNASGLQGVGNRE